MLVEERQQLYKKLFGEKGVDSITLPVGTPHDYLVAQVHEAMAKLTKVLEMINKIS